MISLITTSLIHLLPEAIRVSSSQTSLRIVLVTICGMFLIERLSKLRLQTPSDPSRSDDPSRLAPSSRYSILIGDAAHNFVDGVLIATTFLIDPASGWLLTLSIAVHELPQELADFTVLVHSGLSKGRALAYNFLSALAAIAGALLANLSLSLVQPYLGYLIAMPSGMFLYIAMVDVVSSLRQDEEDLLFSQILPFLAGASLLAWLG